MRTTARVADEDLIGAELRCPGSPTLRRTGPLGREHGASSPCLDADCASHTASKSRQLLTLVVGGIRILPMWARPDAAARLWPPPLLAGVSRCAVSARRGPDVSPLTPATNARR
jgi:hypothetical protein